jgi:hypothetical protein
MEIQTKSNTRKDKWFDNLIHNIELRGFTYEQFKSEYKYSGGNEGRHLNYFNIVFKNKKTPQQTMHCECNHPILENCYVSNNFDYDSIIVMGSCCIKKFIPAAGRTCEICSSPHRNKKNNKCNECRKIKPVISEFKKCKNCTNIIKKQYTRCFNCYQKIKN